MCIRDRHEIRIYPGDGSVVKRVPTTESAGGLRWSPDGSTLYFLDEPNTGGAQLVEYELASERIRTSSLVDSEAVTRGRV